MTQNTANPRRRRQKNIVSIGKLITLVQFDPALIKYHCAVFNLIAWCLDCAGDILSFSLMRYNYLLSMSLAMGVSAGLSPIVYIIGAWDQAGLLLWPSDI